jgi:hypothetical protein
MVSPDKDSICRVLDLSTSSRRGKLSEESERHVNDGKFYVQFCRHDAVIELEGSAQRFKFFNGRLCQFSEPHFIQHLDKFCQSDQSPKGTRNGTTDLHRVA